MRFLIDAQLPPALCVWFEEQGHVAEHVTATLGGQTSDRDIAHHVASFGFALVTKDDDFRLRYPPVNYQLLWLRCGNITNRSLRSWLGAPWPEIFIRLDAGDALIEVR